MKTKSKKQIKSFGQKYFKKLNERQNEGVLIDLEEIELLSLFNLATERKEVQVEKKRNVYTAELLKDVFKIEKINSKRVQV